MRRCSHRFDGYENDLREGGEPQRGERGSGQRASQDQDRYVVVAESIEGETRDDRPDGRSGHKYRVQPTVDSAVRCNAKVSGDQVADEIDLRDYGLWGAIYGFGAEAGLHLIRLISSGVFDEFPQLKVVVGHMGEGLPYWFYRIDHMHKNMVTLAKVSMRPMLKQAPSEYFRTNIAITTSGVNWNEALQFAHRTVGADNIMFAIDYLYERTEDAVRFIRSAPLDAEEMSRITHRNAERIFGIPSA